jgi:resuscitation-promoting factor RpfA
MTDPDERVRRLYGTLPREEPPPALDAAVLAAARRAVAPRSLARRWGAPVSIAAVLVLVVGVTLEMQREEPGVATSVAPSPPAPEAKRGAPAAADALEAATAPRPAAPAAAPPSSESAPAANLSTAKRTAAAEPTTELERIAKLRSEGKDADADRALEAFRREHPAYRIDDAMWERVKPR